MQPRETHFIKLLVDSGLISFKDASRLEEMQGQSSTDSGEYTSVWDIAVKEGLVTADQVRKLLSKIDSSDLAPAAAAAPAEPRNVSSVGNRLGNYELISRMGRGGMGAVYRARHSAMNRIVALKVLPRSMASNERFISRFEREARAAGALNHPNIVAGLDAGFADGYYYFAMEFIEGGSLAALLDQEGALDEKLIARYGGQIAEALQHAHEAGIIHRDVKPENILISKTGVAKLCDLGLARDTSENMRITQDGAAVGTPYYISPELVRGTDPDPRADIYSLGCSLYHLVTGVPPFMAETRQAVMFKRLEEDPRPVTELAPGVSRAMEAVINRMMARDPDARYATAGEVASELERVAAGGVPAVLSRGIADRRRSQRESSDNSAEETRGHSDRISTRKRPVATTRTVKAAVRSRKGIGSLAGQIIVALIIFILAFVTGAMMMYAHQGAPEDEDVLPLLPAQRVKDKAH